MLYLLAVIIGLLFLIMCLSTGPKEGSKRQYGNNKRKDLTEDDVDLIAKILSVGLVDADPNYLSHLKAYRDLLRGV